MNVIWSTINMGNNTVELGVLCSLEKIKITNFKTYNTIFAVASKLHQSKYMSNIKLMYEIHATLSRHHKMSYSVSLSLGTSFTTTRTDLWLG